MIRKILIVGSLATAILIGCALIYMGEGLNLGVFLMLLWDLLPPGLVALSALGAKRAESSSAVKLAAIETFGIVALAITAWEYLDILHYFMTASHISSTTALAFVAYPVVAIVPAGVAAMVTMLIAFIVRRSVHA